MGVATERDYLLLVGGWGKASPPHNNLPWLRPWCTIKCNLRIYVHVWPFCRGVPTGRGLVPPPKIIGAPPPPPQCLTKSHVYMFRFADIAHACVNTLRPHKYHAYVFLNYALKMLILLLLCQFVNGYFPPPATLPWQGDDLFFLLLVSLFRLKKSSFFRWSLGGGGGQMLVPLRKPKALSAPLPHLNNRSYATAFPPPGRDCYVGFEIFNLSYSCCTIENVS